MTSKKLTINEALKEAEEIVAGLREAAIIENVIVDFCAPFVAMFLASDDSDEKDNLLHRVVNSNAAKASARRFTKEADVIQMLIDKLQEPCSLGAFDAE
jgi:hypothetical protein